jgi:hypothetical protein
VNAREGRQDRWPPSEEPGPTQRLGIPPYSSLQEEAQCLSTTRGALAARVVDQPSPGIEVTIKNRWTLGGRPLRVFIRAHPDTGLTFTRIDEEGDRVLDFPDVHLLEALDTGELNDRIRAGAEGELPWAALYPESEEADH